MKTYRKLPTVRERAIAELELRRRNNSIAYMPLGERCPQWANEFLNPCRYKGAYGGRGAGKSHFFAELIIDRMMSNADLKVVCIREIQKSLKYSMKLLIENKIRQLGVGDQFEVLTSEIRHRKGNGLIIFQGMQDHTGDSIKSLEGFSIACVEEGQSLSERSLKLLRPTIRAEGSELWFIWNPENEDDPVDKFLRKDPPGDSIVRKVNYPDNPLFPEVLRSEMEIDRARDIDYYNHVWMGEYNRKPKEQVLGGKWVVQSFEPEGEWDGPYFGCDFGLTALIKCWIHNDYLYVEHESYDNERKLELDDIHDRWMADIPGCDRYIIEADCALPQTISYLKRHGFSHIRPVKKWPGSVDDGIKFLRKFQKIIVHERCEWFQFECQNYKHKVDKRSGNVLPDFVDAHNHLIDSCRYSLDTIIRSKITLSPENLFA